MDIQGFKKQVYQIINANSEANITDVSSEFLDYVTSVMISAGEIEDFTECYFEANGAQKKKVQIDGFHFDQVDNSCCIFILKFDNDLELSYLTSSQTELLYSKMKSFVENSGSGFIKDNCEESGAGYSAAVQLQENLNDITKFKFYVITDKIISDEVKFTKKKYILNKPVELSVWDISRLKRIEESKSGKEEIFIDFSEYKGGGLQCINGNISKKEKYKSYLMTMPGTIIADLYIKYGAKLLEGNVRSFLSVNKSVNRGIRQTIINKPEMFFAYNNGIAAVASEVKMIETEKGTMIKEIKGLQIINGGQTTVSIANASISNEGDITKVFVPMKLSIVNVEYAENIINDIAKYANSQNKIDESDFTSNHPFHIRMEKISRELLTAGNNGNQFPTGWFYERVRGQYNQSQLKLNKTEKKSFFIKWPKAQCITKTDLAKYMNIYDEQPHIVSRGIQASSRYFDRNMQTKWEKSDIQYNEDFYKKVATMAIMFKSTEQIISNEKWYKETKSYKSNIVCYSLAIIISEISKLNDKALDIYRIWNEQRIYAELEKQLKVTTKEVFNFITKEDRPIWNVTQWCKQENCWKQAKEVKWKFTNEFKNTLVSKREVQSNEIRAKAMQKAKNELDTVMEVINKGASYWDRLMKWADNKKILSSMDNELLSIAINIENTGRIPSTKQATKILGVREKMVCEGFID